MTTEYLQSIHVPADAEIQALTRLNDHWSRPDIEPDPVKWAKDDLGIDTYSKQRTILRLLEIVPKLAVPSCHDAGKSFTAALAAARFLAKYPPGTARVVSTAPTMTQVRAILWNEINSLHTRAKKADGTPLLPGRVNQTEWWIGGYMAGIGRKPSDYAPGTFQGLHARHILIILDEAGAVPADLWTGVDTLATNTGAVILAIGNPDDPQAEFERVVRYAEEPDDNGNYNGWTVVRIPAWATPNLSGEKVAPVLNEVLLSKEWVDDKRNSWGEDSALWDAKIAAEFPKESGMSVIRVADVTAAMNRDIDAVDPSVRTSSLRFEDVQLGVDVAGSEEGDETIVRERRGNKLLRRWAVQSGEPEDVADLIVNAGVESNATMIHVDATGVGFGFLSEIRKRLPGVAVMPFVAAARAEDPVQYENRRAEAHWTVRDMLRRRELDFSQMEHAEETVSQMTSARYSIKKGRILVEPKDAIRKRIARSPDDSDAALLAICKPSGTDGPAPAIVRASSAARKRDALQRRAQEAVRNDGERGPRPVQETILPPSYKRARRGRVHSIRGTRQ